MVSWTENDDFDHSSAFNDKVGMILGGMPMSDDILPSSFFIVAYTLLFIPMVFRIKTHTLTFGQLWKPLFLTLMRITTFALRIQLAADSVWNKHIFITELIFFRLGPIILTLAVLQHFSNALLPYIPTIDAPNLPVKITLKYFVLLLTLLTHFCLGLTIAVAFDVKAAINGNAEARVKLHRSKEIAIWLLCVINGSIYFLTAVPFILRRQGKYTKHLIVSAARERTKFISIAAVCTFMMVVSVFKAAQLAAHGQSSHYARVINMKVLFYSVCCVGEYVACALLMGLAWARIAPPAELLEAYCRIHKSENANGATPANRWPGPPGNPAGSNELGRQQSRPTSSGAWNDMRSGLYDSEVPKCGARQARVVSVTVSNGVLEQHEDAHTLRGSSGGQWSEFNFASNSTVNRPSATLGRNVSNESSSVSQLKSRSSRRTSATSLSTISEDCIERDHAEGITTASSAVGNDTYMTCSPGSTLRGDAYRRTSSIDSLALPANLLPSHPNPNAVSVATSHLPPRTATTPTSTPTDTKPFDNVSLSSNSTGEHWRQHQPLTMVKTDSTRSIVANEPQIRTPLRASTFSDHNATSKVESTTISSGSMKQNQPSTSHVSESMTEQPTTSCSVQSRWSEDSDDDAAHFHSSPNSSHGRFHHHLHRHRKPLTAEAWDHEDDQPEDRSKTFATTLA